MASHRAQPYAPDPGICHRRSVEAQCAPASRSPFALAAGLLIAAIGIAVSPGAAPGGLAFSVIIVASTSAYIKENTDSDCTTTPPRRRRAGLITGGSALPAWPTATGLIVLLEQATGVILLTVLVFAAITCRGGEPNSQPARHL